LTDGEKLTWGQGGRHGSIGKEEREWRDGIVNAATKGNT